MSKYAPLATYLRSRNAETVSMSFAEIETVLGFKLPKSKIYPAWWSNNATNNVMTREWLAAGYKTEQVDVEGRKLVFRRCRDVSESGDGERRSDDDEPKHPRRHPLFGWMKGMVTITPETDLTEPADPDWADIAWGAQSAADKTGQAGRG